MNPYSLGFLLYLFLFFTPKIKQTKMVLPIAIFCITCYFSTPYFRDNASLIFPLSLGLILALFLKSFPFSPSFLLCLFVIGTRIMGVPTARFKTLGDLGEAWLVLALCSGVTGLVLLWGIFLVHHAKNYQKFLLLILCFFTLQVVLIALMYEYQQPAPLVFGFTGLLALWGLRLVRRTPRQRSFLFASLTCFVLLSLLCLSGLLTWISWVAYILLGLAMQPLCFQIYKFGEFLLVCALALEVLWKRIRLGKFFTETDPNVIAKYRETDGKHYDDAIMRRAVDDVRKSGKFDYYKAIGEGQNNCQDFVE